MTLLKLIIAGALGPITLAACATTKTAPQPIDQRVAYRDTGVAYPLVGPRPGEAVEPIVQSASLWSNTPGSLFGDRRARGAGDILTVRIEIEDEADLRNSVTTERDSQQNFSLGSFFGLANLIEDALPDGSNLDPGLDIRRGSTVDGTGQLRRRENITLTLAAQVVDLTPNGDLAIAGYQSVQVDGEARTLAITGVIRREDISRRNVITLDKIANAQVVYGGKGIVNRQTRDRLGHRVIDTVVPF